jgi:hypothetical protein
MDYLTIDERIRIQGKVRLTLRTLDGKIVAVRESSNLWVDSGKNYVLNLLGMQAGYEGLTHTSIGTGTNSPSASDTKLQNEVGRREIITSSFSTAKTTTQSSFYENSYPGSTYDITEAALWADATMTKDSGRLFARSVFAAIQKVPGVHTLTVDWVLSIT